MGVSTNSKEFCLKTLEIDSLYHEAAFKLGVADSVLWILYTISLQGEKSRLHDIIVFSGLSKQTVNSALRKLEKYEFIYLENIDSRRKNVCLTEKGKDLAAKSSVIIMGMENDIFDSWPKEDAELFLNLTKRFCNDLKLRVRRL